jgi:hypothetical protein
MDELFTDDDLEQVTAARLTDAQLRRATTLLAKRPAGEQAEQLRQQRAKLLNKATQHPIATANINELRLLGKLGAIAELLGLWHVLSLPTMTEGLDQTPGVPGTHGEIGTSGLYAGGCGYGGEPTDDGTTDPSMEKWWLHNWRCSAVFPAAPYDGLLLYRFTVESECHVYADPCDSGSLQEFVTIGRTANVGSQSPFDDPQIQTVGWPVDISLPYAGSLNFGGPTAVLGSIPVHAGDVAGLAFIYGTIVSVANGYIQFSWGNFGTRRTLPQGQPSGASDFDKIEYRFEPDWWIQAVSKLKALP